MFLILLIQDVLFSEFLKLLINAWQLIETVNNQRGVIILSHC